MSNLDVQVLKQQAVKEFDLMPKSEQDYLVRLFQSAINHIEQSKKRFRQEVFNESHRATAN